jgi:hypothetical protein
MGRVVVARGLGACDRRPAHGHGRRHAHAAVAVHRDDGDRQAGKVSRCGGYGAIFFIKSCCAIYFSVLLYKQARMSNLAAPSSTS